MTRLQKDRLAAQLREIIDELREAPMEAIRRAEKHIDEQPVAKLLGAHAVAFGPLQASVESAVAHLEAVVSTHLEKRRTK